MKRERIPIIRPHPKSFMFRLLLSIMILAQVISLVQPLPAFATADETSEVFEPTVQEELESVEVEPPEEEVCDIPEFIASQEEAVSEKEQQSDESDFESLEDFEESLPDDPEELSDTLTELEDTDDRPDDEVTSAKENPDGYLESEKLVNQTEEVENGSTRYMELQRLLEEQSGEKALYTRFFDVLTEEEFLALELQGICEMREGEIRLFADRGSGFQEQMDYMQMGESVLLLNGNIQIIAVAVYERTASGSSDAADADEILEETESLRTEQEDNVEIPLMEPMKMLLGATAPAVATAATYTTDKLTVSADVSELDGIASVIAEILTEDGTAAAELELNEGNAWSDSWFGAAPGATYAMRVKAVYDAEGNEISGRWSWSTETDGSNAYTQNVGNKWMQKSDLSVGSFVFSFALGENQALLAATNKTVRNRYQYYPLTCEFSAPEEASNAAIWKVTVKQQSSSGIWGIQCQSNGGSLLLYEGNAYGEYIFGEATGSAYAINFMDCMFYGKSSELYGIYDQDGAKGTRESATATLFTPWKLENVTYQGTEHCFSLSKTLNSEECTSVCVRLNIGGSICDRSLEFDFCAYLGETLIDTFRLGHEDEYVIQNVPIGRSLIIRENSLGYTAISVCGDTEYGAEFILETTPSDGARIDFQNRLDGVIETGLTKNDDSLSLILSLAILTMIIRINSRVFKNNKNKTYRRIRSMKKCFAVILAILICSFIGAPAYADADANFNLIYTITGGSGVPNEQLSFSAEAVTGNPDSKMISLETPVQAAASGTVAITYPTFETPGLYKYKITQMEGSSQGTEYDKGEMIFQVLFGYGQDGTLSVLGSGVASNGTEKKDGFTNSYTTGSLALTAVTNGTSPDKEKVFAVTVTLVPETGKTVNSIISYTDDGTPTNIAAGWSDNKTISITLKDGETVTFTGIPAGISYTVEEADSQGYENNINPSTGSITADASAVTVTNTDKTALETGISLDSLPYMIVLALVVSGFIFLLLRRRREEEEDETEA